MQSQYALKREFLKKWLRGLERCESSKEKMNLFERKNAIRLSANLAMASTRKGNTRSWSHALIVKASKDTEIGSLANRILGSDQHDPNAITTRAMIISSYINKKKMLSRKIIRKVKKNYAPRKCGPSSNNSKKMRARSMAKRLVKKRTNILRGLVPGGEEMDEYSLIKEALDYLVSLRAQVDVMHHLANAPQLILNHN